MHKETELTFATTANTMGPKIMFTFISMLLKSLDKSRRVRECGLLASGGGRAGMETTEGEGKEGVKDLGGGEVVKGGFLP